MTKEPICNRCGRCCYYEKDGVWRKCRYLVHIGKLSSCRIWNDPDRIGREIDTGVFCGLVSDLPHGFVGCPYNTEKPMKLITIGRYDGKMSRM